ncbi:MAG TPA: glycerophosphodiester phosphodiesterase [Devosia sp.]|nr:glycerophosphodiester phosphodiesterase [Devosia sp.]
MTQMDEILKRPIAHRGLHNREKGVIENSKTAFAQAIKAGYGIECDLQLSGDGVPMVFHDAELDRLTRQAGKISSLSAGQIGRIKLTASKRGDTPQTFSEFLEQVDGAVPIVVELKKQNDARNRQLASAAVKAAKDYKGLIAFKSFYPGILSGVRAAGFSGPIGIIVTRVTSESKHFKEFSMLERLVMHNLLHYPQSRFDFISADHKALDLPAIRFLRKLGFPVMTWTINSFETAQKARPHADQLVFENYLPYRAPR